MDRIDEVAELLEEIAETIPKEFYRGLTGGIVLSEELMIHPEAVANDLVILGQYQRGPWGSTIVIYYGSFMKLYGHASREELKARLEDTLLHEFTHHLEYLGGERGLEEKDRLQMEEYRREHKAWKGLDANDE